MGRDDILAPKVRSAMDRAWRHAPMPNSPPEDEFKPNDRSHSSWLKKQAKAFGNLRDVPEAAARIARAIREEETITLSGDYDCDGNCSTAIMRRFLLDAGVPDEKIRVHIPNREEEGYGFNETAAEAAKQAGTGLIITLDNGTKAHDAIKVAMDSEMDVVVLDHHPNSPGEKLPAASDGREALVVNPGRADESPENGAFKPLAAAGVTLMMTQCVHELLGDYYETHPLANVDPVRYTGTATLATVADVVDISGSINRTLIRYGLRSINRGDDAAIQAMLAEAGLQGNLTSEDIAFNIAPRINAPGRLNQSISWELLSSDNPEHISHVLKNIQQVFDNKERQRIEAELTITAREQAREQKENGDPILFVGGEGWHEGVIGIVAGRMKEEFGRPVIAYSIQPDGSVKCSARNLKVEGYQTDIGQALRDFADEGVLLKAGGHVMAAGATFHKNCLDEFRQTLNDRLGEQTLEAVKHDDMPIAQIITLDNDLEALLEEQEKHQPFGENNPRPKVLIPNVRTMDTSQAAGPTNRHILNIRLRDTGTRHSKTITAHAFHAGGTAMEPALLKAMRVPSCVLGTLNRDRSGNIILLINDVYVPSKHRSQPLDAIGDILGKNAADTYQQHASLPAH